jgi:putative CocE/NonD family hydrolase
MKTITEFAHKCVEIEDMGIVLSDGCRLSARVWMPNDTEALPVPAILEYIPYRKRDGTTPRDELMHPYVAGHGYACVRVDMRGSGDSAGLMSDEYTAQELADACEVIAWLAAQDWCSGAVGMMGKSWGGFNCLQTAFLQPPALKAVISVCSTTDRFASDIHFRGGALLGENFGWGAVMLSFSSRPADPALRADWRKDWLARLEAEPWLAPVWAEHQSKDDYWKHGSVGEDFVRMTVPVLAFGGWADNYMNAVSELVRGVPAPAQGIVGPWVHQYPHMAVPGPAIGFLQVALRWWDRWLKGIENGAEADPAYRAYMLHSAPPDASARHRDGHWVAEAAWPSARVERKVLSLGALAPAAGGCLPPDPRGYLGTDNGVMAVKIATPQHLGISAGEFFPMGLNAEMAGDQRPDDAMSVCFDGAPLAEGLDLLGAARLRLQLASDKPLAFIVARLCDVAPDGASVRIAHGILNLCHRDSMSAPERMVPGQPVDLTFDLDQMAYRLAPGHRLRLALSNSYWPFVWPSPEAASLTLTSGALELPVHIGSDAEWEPPEPEAALGFAHRVLREGGHARRVETDLISGEVALICEDDGGDIENLSHGLISGETMREVWAIHPDDPLSARAEHMWEQRLSRGDWRVKTRVEARMTATATHLTMTAWLRAWEGETLIFEREFDNQVMRRYV